MKTKIERKKRVASIRRTEVLSEGVFREYFGYLCSLVGSPDIVISRENLLETLFRTKFVTIIPYDDNRIEDGRNIREEFADLTGTEVSPYFPGTVLEVLIGISRRLNFILYDFSGGDKTQDLFWKLIENLDLILVERNESDTERNKEIIDRFITREYDFNGRGGIFPLYRRPKEDQRKIELWYQMANWVNENYQY